MRTAGFTLEDFLSQLREIKKMGPLTQLVEMLPGMSRLASRMPDGTQEKQLKKIEAGGYSKEAFLKGEHVDQNGRYENLTVHDLRGSVANLVNVSPNDSESLRSSMSVQVKPTK
jgi:hypothetical protein